MVDHELLQAISSMLDTKFEYLFDKKLEYILDKKLDEKLAPIIKRLEDLEARMENVEARLENLEARLENLEGRMENLEIRMVSVETDVASLKAGQIKLTELVEELDKKVSDTYELALEAWGTGVENRKWLEGSPKFLRQG